MMKRLFIFVLALTLSVFAASAAAQTITTGSIEGQVFDPNGAVVPGITVTATGPQTLVPKVVTTDDSGHYRISALSPGLYTVTVEAYQGFGKFEKTDVGVNLDRTSSFDIQLQLATTQVNVTVTATENAAIDVNSNTTGSNVSTEQFSNFPTQRTVQSLFAIAPTVARSGLVDASGRDINPSVAGSSGPESNFILDGVNTTDPAFGGAGANLPFEFVQEVQIKTGAFGAENGRSTGGIFNVITKDGTNEFHGDVFGYFTTQSMVRETKQFAFVGAARNGFSELDAGVDVGGPIVKNKLTFFGAFNPQRRTNYSLTQTYHAPVSAKLTTPFYSGKLKWQANQNNIVTFSTFSDFTTQKGFVFGFAGFTDDLASSRATIETGGHNYTARLNSTINPNWIGEFAFGLHFQRANVIPESSLDIPLINNSFAVVRDGAALTPTHSSVVVSAATGTGDFVNGTGGSLERNFLHGPGYGLYSTQDRNRWEGSARFQNVIGGHTLKYGFEYGRNIYKINTLSTGPSTSFSGIDVAGYRVTNNFGVCQTQSNNTTIVCPAASLTARIQALINAGVNLGGPTSVSTDAAVISSISANPFLIRTSTRVRDFRLTAPDGTNTNMEAFYIQDDFKVTRNLQLNVGVRWDYEQAYGSGNFSYVKLNNFWDNLQPRLGFTWDFTGKGKGKVFMNYAKYLETPLPLDVNVRAGSDTTQTDVNLNVDTINAPIGSTVVANFGNLGATHTPLDPGLKPQDVREATAGFEYEVKKNLVLGIRGVYRWQGQVIEDGSFDDGANYFIFNPGRRGNANQVTTEDLACAGDPATNRAPRCFGPARRYFRAFEITATKRFSDNWQFIGSYVFSSLIGNYEGLFRNDNGQADPNITSLFDLQSLLDNTYGRLPNDRPHQFKFDGSYRTRFKLLVGGSFRAQSGIPYNELTPHPVYGNNEGFGVPRGTAIVPTVAASDPAFPNVVDSIGSNRTPTTWNLDLNGSYPITLGETKEIRFQVDWFNVFNNQRAVRLDETFSINSGIPGVANIPANRLPNPFYGAGTIFQVPSSLRLGVKFTF